MTRFLRLVALAVSASSGVPLSALSSIRHWHLALDSPKWVWCWLPRRQRACPSAALDERVLLVLLPGNFTRRNKADCNRVSLPAMATDAEPLVSVCIPARDEEATIGHIVGTVR